MIDNKIIKILENNFEKYKEEHDIPWFIRNIVEKYIKCRTEKMGGHLFLCPNCGHEEFGYNSCRLRGCPKCNEGNIKEWLNRTIPKLLAIDHFHFIFTIPEEFNQLFLDNKVVLTNLLFKAVNDSLDYFLLDKKWLGGIVGKILTLHTWNSEMDLHPHIHCLVSSMGLSEDGTAIQVRRDYLLPVVALSNVFRAKFIAYIRKAISKGEIKESKNIIFTELKIIISKLFNKNWNVFICPRYSHGKGILIYLSKYIKGGCIKNSRIIDFDENRVVLKIRDKNRENKEELKPKKRLTLSIKEFIRRYLLHIHPSKQNTVRYYGLYSPNSREKLKLCMTLEDQDKLMKSFEKKETEFLCPKCQTKMEFLANFTYLDLQTNFEEKMMLLKKIKAG